MTDPRLQPFALYQTVTIPKWAKAHPHTMGVIIELDLTDDPFYDAYRVLVGSERRWFSGADLLTAGNTP